MFAFVVYPCGKALRSASVLCVRFVSIASLLLCCLAALPVNAAAASAATPNPYANFIQKVEALEKEHGGRLGVAMLRTRDGTLYTHRGDELFAHCSVFKVVAVANLLRRSQDDPVLLKTELRVNPDEIQPFSYAIHKYLNTGISLEEVARICLSVSDNTAANMLLRALGGPEAVTAYARSIGDEHFRVDRFEMEMNEAVPGDERDTTTPRAMALTLNKLLLGDALAPPQRETLRKWMVGCLTGVQRIRAGTPRSWTLGHKTGTGDYGATNAVGVLWPPVGTPLVLVVFYSRDDDRDAVENSEIIEAVTRLATQPGA